MGVKPSTYNVMADIYGGCEENGRLPACMGRKLAVTSGKKG